MKRIIAIGCVLCATLLIPVSQTWAAANSDGNGHPGTVDYFTPAQKMRAFDAAIEAGYAPTTVEAFQDGNFFLAAKKEGKYYQMTVAPTGQIYPSKPLTPRS